MNIKIFVLILFSLFVSCAAQQVEIPQPIPMPTVPLPAPMPPEPSEAPKREFNNRPATVDKRLNNYFGSRALRPAIIINNLYNGVREEREEMIEIANHKVVWFHSFGGTKIKINGDLISLKGKRTLNAVEGKDDDNVDFANNWDQIKLFRFGDRKLIGISMFNDPCTGNGCRVHMYLIYDLKNKTGSFFGTYRFLLDREFGLFDFGNDGKLDFLSGTYKGETSEFQNLYQIFTLDDAGGFHLLKNDEGKPYFMKRVYSEEGYEEIDEKFEAEWPEKIR